MEIPVSSTVEKMEADTNGPTAFIEISADNLLEGFTPETKIPVSSETIIEDQPQSIAITDIHSLSENTYIETEQQDKKPLPPPQQRLKCPECDRYTASNQDQLTRHIRKVHRGENPFQCFMCDYSTYNSTLFDEHVRIHKGIKPFKCSFCPHRNVSKKNLKRHEKIHRPDNPLKCSHCDFIARNQRAFNNHMKKFHTLDKSLTCTWCDNQYPDINALVVHTTHVKSCDTIMSDSEKCDYVTCSAHRLKMHKISEHGEEHKARSDLWKCSLCEWSGNSKYRILLHLIHHPNQKVDENVIDISILKKHGIM